MTSLEQAIQDAADIKALSDRIGREFEASAKRWEEFTLRMAAEIYDWFRQERERDAGVNHG
jgi:hypothetical protein